MHSKITEIETLLRRSPSAVLVGFLEEFIIGTLETDENGLTLAKLLAPSGRADLLGIIDAYTNNQDSSYTDGHMSESDLQLELESLQDITVSICGYSLS